MKEEYKDFFDLPRDINRLVKLQSVQSHLVKIISYPK